MLTSGSIVSRVQNNRFDQNNRPNLIGYFTSTNFKKDASMSSFPQCPTCRSEYTYEDGSLYVCPDCGHEWVIGEEEENLDLNLVVLDAYGNLLQDGDTVTLIKGLKIKGSSSAVKVGTKVKGIRLVEGDHNIDCKIDGIGAMKLKSEFVKKA